MTVLEVKDLQVSLDGRKIIGGLSFSVQRGETLTVLGPNGVGKTTLVRAITGLVPTKAQSSFSERTSKITPANN